MNDTMNCKQSEKLIFCLAEPADDSGLSIDERSLLEQHLENCLDCYQLYADELRLSSLLRKPVLDDNVQRATRAVSSRYINWRPVLATLAALLLFAIGFWKFGILSSAADAGALNYGSIVSRTVLTPVGFTPAKKTKSLSSSNHVDVPGGTSVTIRLNEAGQINAIGPATFEIDKAEWGWKITLLEGQLAVGVDGTSQIEVATRTGVKRFDDGEHFVRSTGGFSRVDSFVNSFVHARVDDLAVMLKQGLDVFQADSNATKEQYAESAIQLIKVFEHPDASEQQKMIAGFYGVAALSNSEQPQKVLEVGEKWMENFDGEMGELVPVMLVKANIFVGNREVAMKDAEMLLEKFPQSPYAPMLASAADPSAVSAPTGFAGLPPDRKLPYTNDAESQAFMAGQSDGYLIVNVGLDENDEEHARFKLVSDRAADFHNADVITFDGIDFVNLRKRIAKYKPANVLFVITPDKLDVNFHRHVFKIAPTLDNDLFVDFSWGYLTARDSDALEKFWIRIEGLHKNGLTNNNWLGTSVLGGDSKSYASSSNELPAAKSAGFVGDQLYFACFESDPDVLEFIDKKRSSFEKASVITMTGNGDPSGIWLFDGNRNMDSNLHWNFEKSKVGQDPNNEMLRLKPDWFRKLKLNSPIIWSGTCHSGACKRVFVEGDIVSTYGKSDKTEVYDLKPDESLGLAFIDAGAGSLMVPIASNHGISVSLENDFMLKHGVTLGQTMKSTYDDAIMQSQGIPKLLIAKEGGAHNYHGEPIMQSGAANRILIGDPSLSLFKATEVESEKRTVTYDESSNRLKVSLDWKSGYHPAAWNLYSDGHGFEQRMKTRLECTEMVDLIAAARENQLKVEVTVTNGKGASVDCDALVAVETLAGRSYLYLQTTINEDTVAHEAHFAAFSVTW